MVSQIHPNLVFSPSPISRLFLWFCGEIRGSGCDFGGESGAEAGGRTGWMLLVAVLACHGTGVLKALMAVVESPWCRILAPARQHWRATLVLLCYLYFCWLYSCVHLVSP